MRILSSSNPVQDVGHRGERGSSNRRRERGGLGQARRQLGKQLLVARFERAFAAGPLERQCPRRAVGPEADAGKPPVSKREQYLVVHGIGTNLLRRHHIEVGHDLARHHAQKAPGAELSNATYS
ncbi:hypothetical protein [Bradyrhizobium sp. MOS003]|uniref:hypothetical protein n=1 Tax=Bradyrhizobium sp. MOS003 TaxID=2133946 RepID=UPI0011BF209C|nr:hypothetical protein [Bradyrhizobium sp. MOS003]